MNRTLQLLAVGLAVAFLLARCVYSADPEGPAEMCGADAACLERAAK